MSALIAQARDFSTSQTKSVKSAAKTYLLDKKISDVKSNAHVRYLRIETEESLLNELMH